LGGPGLCELQMKLKVRYRLGRVVTDGEY